MKKVVAGALLLAVASACAGAKGNVRFDSLKYPVSMSPVLYDSDGRMLYHERQLKSVDKFQYSRWIWSMFWTGLVFNREQDLSAPVNQKIEESGGQGIVNLTVTTSGCFLNYVPLVSILPIWPGCTVVSIHGDVVKKDAEKK